MLQVQILMAIMARSSHRRLSLIAYRSSSVAHGAHASSCQSSQLMPAHVHSWYTHLLILHGASLQLMALIAGFGFSGAGHHVLFILLILMIVSSVLIDAVIDLTAFCR